MADEPRAVVLLSGGLDSATCLAVARRDGFLCHALSFRYGQRHATELDAARRVAGALGAADHRVIDLDPGAFRGSALTGAGAVPKDRPGAARAEGIPPTYVPARNTIFLAFALGLAETLAADAIYIGVNAVDYSGYPDCRPEFIRAFRALAALATKRAAEGAPPDVRAPLVELTKAEIIRLGTELGVDYGLTRSCYDPDPAGRACGRCDSCAIRRAGFLEAGVSDPTEYAPAGDAP
jgi:7-cyano-7-deazaguanine synthase